MVIPQWLTLILDNRKSFLIEGGELAGSTDYIYDFDLEVFAGRAYGEKTSDVEVILRIDWSNPNNLRYSLDFWNVVECTNLRSDGDQWIEISSSSPAQFCSQLDFLFDLAKAEEWL